MIKCARRLARLGAGMIGFSATLAMSISTEAASAPFSPRKNLESESIHRTSSMNKPDVGRKKPPKKPFHATGEQHVTIKFKRKIRSGGGGMFASSSAPHSSQAVTKQYIGMRSPTSTPLDLVQMLPSMNVSTPDPTGMQGGALSVRGLTGDDMALLLNGTTSTPLAYFNEVSDPENLQSVTITPGSSSIDLPASSAAAGVMEVTQSDPTNARTGLMDFTYGSNDLSREFIRLDTGKIANTGVSSFFSFSHENSHSWMGVGRNDRKHIDFGLKKTWGNGSNWNIHTSFNDEDFTVDNYPTAGQFKDYKHTGNGWGHSGKYTGIGNDNGSGDNYYKANMNSYKQLFVSAPLHLFLTNRLSLDIKPYLSYGTGWVGAGTGACVYGTSYENSKCGHYDGLKNASGGSVAPGTAINDIWNNSSARTAGVITKFNMKWDRHNETTIGYWYENYANEYSTNTNIISANGAINGPNSNPTYLNGQRNETSYDAGYALNSWFIQNRSHYFHDKLVVMAGFKYVMSSFWNKTRGPTQNTKQTFHPTAPLPQLSIGYKINDHHQFYLNAQGDFRQPDPGSLVQMTTIPKTQYSIKEELGYRYNNRYFMVDLSFFNYNITDRLNTNCLNSACTLRSTYNSGSQTSRGFDALIAGHAWHHISPYASIEYLHATIDSDTKDPNTGLYLPTKGLQAPLAPHVLANFGLTYSTKSFFGNFGMHYAGPQSTTLMGTERIPGYITDNISLGYHFHSLPFAHSPTLKLNFQNLTGSIVRTSANGVSLGTSGNPAYYLTVPRFFMSGTISTSF